jgi:hypothetical protein
MEARAQLHLSTTTPLCPAPSCSLSLFSRRKRAIILPKSIQQTKDDQTSEV